MAINIRIEEGAVWQMPLSLYQIVGVRFPGKEAYPDMEINMPVERNFLTVQEGQSVQLIILTPYADEDNERIIGKLIVPEFMLVGQQEGGLIAVVRRGEAEGRYEVTSGDSPHFKNPPDTFKRMIGIPVMDGDSSGEFRQRIGLESGINDLVNIDIEGVAEARSRIYIYGS